MYVSVIVKDRAGTRKEAWLAREIETLVKNKKDAWDGYRQLGSCASLEKFKEYTEK